MAHPLPSALLPVIVNDTYLQEHPIYHILLYNKDYRKTSGDFLIGYCLREPSHMIASNFYPASSGCSSQIREIYGCCQGRRYNSYPTVYFSRKAFCKEPTISVYKEKKCLVKSKKVNVYSRDKEYIFKDKVAHRLLKRYPCIAYRPTISPHVITHTSNMLYVRGRPFGRKMCEKDIGIRIIEGIEN